nr:putative reverse transcriptase domain-containing protein [Tanacetum cinerariifolium]
MTRDSSYKHFFRLETWKVLWTFLSSSGSPSLYATRPIRSRILNGPMYRGLSSYIGIASLSVSCSLQALSNLHYFLGLPEELRNVHNTFHVSNLKKCLYEESLVIPMKKLRLDDKLNFMEEPVEIMDREVKQLKQSRIPIVKVIWNSKRGPEFTW